MSRLLPILTLLVCASGCCVSVATKVRNETGRDILLTVVGLQTNRAFVAIPANSSRICGGVFDLGNEGRYRFIVSDGKTNFIYPDVSEIGRLPDAFRRSSRFTRDFPCLRFTSFIRIDTNMLIHAVPTALRHLPQPSGFPIRPEMK